MMKPFSLAPDNVPPSFPVSSRLDLTGLSMTGVTVSWPNATDDVGIVGYRVYWETYPTGCTDLYYCANGVLAGTVSPGTNSFTVNGLNPGVHYLIWVEAGDASGNWVIGVDADVTTYTVLQQYWYLFAAGGVFLVAVLLFDEHVKERRKRRQDATHQPRHDLDSGPMIPKVA